MSKVTEKKGIGENVEQLEPSYTDNESLHWYICFGKLVASTQVEHMHSLLT